MKKMILVNPVGQRSGFLLSKFSSPPPLSLAYVAAVTPSDWEVKILDENHTPFKFEEADLVGITTFTSNINRAYEIASSYKEKNIKVIFGGIHASMLPDEALQFGDTVVIGEVEGIWAKVIEDFETGSLQPIYQGPQINLRQSTVLPRRDLLHPNYYWNSVQTSRGCPFNCDFCSVTNYLGREYRFRDPEAILEELDQIPGQYIAFMDDNLIGYSPENKKRAGALFEGMIKKGYRKKWYMQTSINAAEDEPLLELAARAGCTFAFLGFETTSPETLKSMKKGINLKIGTENYKKVIDSFHKYGIGVFGSFILGNDFESPAYYKKLAKEVVHAGVDIVQISISTPLPGTALMERMKKEDRLIFKDFPADWKKYRLSWLVHHPRGIDAETIYRGDNYIKKRIYSFPRYPYRMMKSLYSLKSGTNFYLVRKFNQTLKKSWQNSQYYSKYPHTL